MKKELNKIQDKVIDFLKSIDSEKSLECLATCNCSELSRLVGVWMLEKDSKIKVTILKGHLVFGKNLYHDILMIEKEKILYLFDPTIWQFFKNEKSIFLGSFKKLEGAFEKLKKKYGGSWEISEIVNKNADKEKLEKIIIKNIKMGNSIQEKLIKKYKCKKVLVWGLGLHGGGVGTASFFAKLGADVLVTDMKTDVELKTSIAKLKKFKNITYHLGGHQEDDFKNSDFIIRGPGVKDDNNFLKIAKKAKIKIENDVGIFFENSPAFKIGITGTKGKSTLTALIYELLKYEVEKGKNKNLKKFNKVFLGGNIRKSVFDCLKEADEKTITVFELSSFQLDHARYVKTSPDVAIVTNLYPEHLNFHGTFKKYEEAKTMIFRFQKKEDFLIIPKELRSLAKGVKSKISIFDKDHPDEVLKIIAEYFGISDKTITHVKKHFKGLEGRQELVKKINSRTFINDTTATHPLSIIYSLKRFENPILIMGGIDKGFGAEVNELAEMISKRKIRIVMLPGTFSDTIKKKFKKTVPLYEVGSMGEAVKKAYSISVKNDIILLSPGGASFNLFLNEFDRGDKFVEEIGRLK